MNDIRIGIIGAGRFTRLWHLPRLAVVDNARIVAMADPKPEELAQTTSIAGAEGVELFASAEQMLDTASLDAVIVATPHALHFDHVAMALDRGLHVLVDKPVAQTSAEIRKLVTSAEEKGLVLAVGYQRRFQPPYVELRNRVASGELGRMLRCTAELAHGWVERYRGHWRQRPEIGEGGVLTDSGRHLIDAVLWITGRQPAEVFAVIENDGHPFEVAAALTVTFHGGGSAHICVEGRVPSRLWQENLTVWGANASAAVRNGELVWLGDPQSTADRSEATAPAEESPEENFCRAVSGEGTNLCGARHDLRVALLLEAAAKSAAAGHPVAYETEE